MALEDTKMDENPVIAKWDELKALVVEMELDLVKNARGNAAAGLRTRKRLRTLKGVASDLVKLTLERDKAEKTAEKPVE